VGTIALGIFERLSASSVAVIISDLQRRAPRLVPHLHPRPRTQQETHDGGVVGLSGEHQWREAIRLLVVDLRAALEQQVDDPFVAPECGLRQRIAAFVALLVHLGAALQQCFDHRLVPKQRGLP